MKTLFTLLFGLILTSFSFAQIYPDKYFIAFTDKNNSPYSIENPQEFLSQRALERRERFNIAIDEHDLPVNPQYLQAIADIGVQLINPTKWLNGVTISTNDQSKLNEIAALPFVANVFKNIVLAENKVFPEIYDQFSLNKPFGMNEMMQELKTSFKSGESINSLDYGAGFNQINMIGGIALHDDGFMGQGMVIAVLDGGFFATDEMDAFDSLYMNNRILGTRDFVGGGTNVYQGSTHGTAVLSTMGANLPGQLVGTAPEASYWLFRTEDTGTEYMIEEYNWSSGAEYADSVGADVINSSLSYKTFDEPLYDHIYSQMDGNTAPSTIAADMAASRGMIIVNSAGNDGGTGYWPYIGAPADGDSVFTIGAVDADGQYAYFSSIGPTADGRVKPNFMAQGANTVVASTNGGTATSSGTSFSSPISAGITACLWQANPTMNNMEILNSIQLSGSMASNPDNQMGYGIPDFGLANLIMAGISADLVTGTNAMYVFPNPFYDELKVVFNSPDTQSVSLEVFDVGGKLVFSRQNIQRNTGLNYFKFNDLRNLQQGFYFLKITSDAAIVTKKIMKFK
jgi:subtilisin family serine protease